MLCREFIVAARSVKANSFGLHGLVLVAETGEAWEVGVNHMCLLKQGGRVHVGVREFGVLDWATLGFEIPRLLPRAPKAVVDEAWSTHRSIAAADEAVMRERRADDARN